jgi:hypothetical protein
VKKKLLVLFFALSACGCAWQTVQAIKSAFLDAEDYADPCKALREHQEYWKAIDLDPLRRIALKQACEGKSVTDIIIEETKQSINNAVSQADEFVKQAKSFVRQIYLKLSAPMRAQIQSNFFNKHNPPHRHEVAYVRNSSDPISPQERAHRQSRFQLVKEAQENFLGIKLADNEVLDISFSLSGGGLRAAFCGLGTLLGAQKIGLLDCVMTIGALSGGTWILFPWLASGLEIGEYKERFIAKWERGIPILSPYELSLILDDAILPPLAFEKDVTLTNIWNGVLLSILASEHGDKRQRITLSSLANNISKPVPVGEAAWAGLGNERIFEFTPYEVGSRWLQAYIPTWGLGRLYENGISINFAPEDPLPLGIFGSAYAAQAKRVANELLAKAPEFIKETLRHIFETKLGEIRNNPGLINNYTKNMPASPIRNEEDLPLADSGSEKVLPLAVLYRGEQGAHPDMIFTFDCGSGKPGTELKLTEVHAEKTGLQVPNLTPPTDIKNQSLTVFSEKNAAGNVSLSKPVLLYMPRVRDPRVIDYLKNNSPLEYQKLTDSDFDIDACIDAGPCGTFNFSWTRDLAEKTIMQTELNLVTNKATMQKIMLDIVMEKRKQQTTAFN